MFNALLFLTYNSAFLSSSFCLITIKGTYCRNRAESEETECQPGSFNEKINAKECKDCPLGWSQPDKKSQSCIKCNSGFYQGEDFKKCLQCPKGYFQPLPEQSECSICELNTYNDKEGSNSTDACKPCPKNEKGETLTTQRMGEVGIEACTEKSLVCDPGQRPTIDGQCADCPQGFYGKLQGGTKCLLCPNGYYQSNKGAKYCTECDSNDVLCQLAAGAIQTTKDRSSSSSYDGLFKPSTSKDSIPKGFCKKKDSLINCTTETKEDDGDTSASATARKQLQAIQGWTLETRNYAMTCLATLIVLVIASHRWYPLCCKKADLLFAGAHFIDDTVSFLIYILSIISLYTYKQSTNNIITDFFFLFFVHMKFLFFFLFQ